MQEKINIAFADILKEVNESVARIVSVTMNYSEFLQEAMKKDVSSIKRYLAGARDVSFDDNDDPSKSKAVNPKTEASHQNEDSNSFIKMFNFDGMDTEKADVTENDNDEDTNPLASIDEASKDNEEWEFERT